MVAARVMRRNRSSTSLLAAVLVVMFVLVAFPEPASAARYRVRATGNDRWRPAHLFISEGDKVVWRNPDDRRHNVVAYGGGWRLDRMLDPGERVRRVFDEARNNGDPYAYRCTLHSAIVDGRCEGMCGLVHVFAS
jgi:plastocyanin